MDFPITEVTATLTLVLPILAGLYSFWAESRKDGFDQEASFDLVFSGMLFSLFITLIYSVVSTRGFSFAQLNLNPFSLLFGFVLGVSFFALTKGWSVYRVLDELAISMVLGSAFWVLLTNLRVGIKPFYVIAPVLLFVIAYFLTKYRELVAKSGLLYCVVALLFCLAAGAAYKNFTADLIFIAALFTLTLVILVARIKVLYGKLKVRNHTAHNA